MKQFTRFFCLLAVIIGLSFCSTANAQNLLWTHPWFLPQDASRLVSKIDFEASLVPQSETVELHWHIEAGVERLHASIERSADGQTWHRHSVVDIPAYGSAKGTFQDKQPMIGLNYYRIRYGNEQVGWACSSKRIIDINHIYAATAYPR